MNREEKILKEFYNEKKFVNNVEEKLDRLEKYKTDYWTQTQEEKDLYQKFCEIANKDPDQKFKFNHIEKLGVNADIVIIYGKKGIGKTFQISKIIEQVAEEDSSAEVILMRNTVSEFQALEKQLTVSYCPIFMKNRTTNNPNLFHKEILDGDKPRYMGFCAALTGFSLESAKGAEYPNVRLIIWDECTNIGEGSGGYDSSDIYRFITFLDSIIRNKTNVKVYIFGNFHRNTDGKVSDVLLDTLNIPYGCTLKVREKKSKDNKNTSRLLYINTGSLYSGIDTNAKVSLFSNEIIQEDLFTNLPRSFSNMIGALNLFYSHTPEWGLLFRSGKEIIILLLSSFKSKKNDTTLELNWMVHLEVFPTNEFVHNIYTSSVSLYNTFNGYGIEMISKQEEYYLILDLYEICMYKSLYFSSDISRELFDIQMDKWQEKYNLGLGANFFGYKQKENIY